MLYTAAIDEEKERLVETAKSQARLIEAVARFDSIYSKDYPAGPEAATLSQIVDGHSRYAGFGRTGEFTLARREGENIVFLLSHRHFDLEHPKPVPFESDLAEPMRRALSNLSGTVIGLDYRGVLVLAAHEPVSELDLGIVAKIDLAELRAPFVRAAVVSGGFALLAILAGAILFTRVTNPIIRRLQEQTEQTEKLNTQLKQEIEERKQAEDALEWESKVNAALAELAKALTGTTQSIDEISLIVLDQARRLARSEHGFVSSIDPETGDNIMHTFTPMMDSCPVEEGAKRIRFPKEEEGKYGGLWGHALNTMKGFFTDAPKTHPSCRGTPKGHIPLNAFLTVPVAIGSELLGQIALANPQYDYSDQDLDAVHRFGELYALALQRHRAREELIRYQRHLEDLVVKRTRHLEAEVAERRRTEEALRSLSGRLISAQEEERSHVARELHDDISQRLALFGVELEQLGQTPPESVEEIRSQTMNLWKGIRELSSDLHNMSLQLHPSQLKHVGLLPALRRLCENLSKQQKFRIVFDHGEIPRIIPEDVALCLYRIAQEALNNAVKHSGALEARVTLSGSAKELYLQITDSGVGFDPESTKGKRGLGLVSMRERLRLVGGTISVQSQSSGGTKVEARIPLSNEG
jgi:signal transduction histidine kinase